MAKGSMAQQSSAKKAKTAKIKLAQASRKIATKAPQKTSPAKTSPAKTSKNESQRTAASPAAKKSSHSSSPKAAKAGLRKAGGQGAQAGTGVNARISPPKAKEKANASSDRKNVSSQKNARTSSQKNSQKNSQKKSQKINQTNARSTQKSTQKTASDMKTGEAKDSSHRTVVQSKSVGSERGSPKGDRGAIQTKRTSAAKVETGVGAERKTRPSPMNRRKAQTASPQQQNQTVSDVESVVTSRDADRVETLASSEQDNAAKAAERKKRRTEIKFDRDGDLLGQWQVLFERAKGIDPLPYRMSDHFEARTPILHQVLGWGFVLSSQNNRIEVLFKDGIKILVSNYKP